MKTVVAAMLLALLCISARDAFAQVASENGAAPSAMSISRPIETKLSRAGSTSIDLRNLSHAPPRRRFREEREEPSVNPVALPGGLAQGPAPLQSAPSAPAPAAISNFLGLDYTNWGSGRPPDTVGDVGPAYFIQAVNASIGIFRKSDSVRVAAFTFDTFMSQGNFGNLCDTDNFGDPVVLYDSFEDRWVITDFAFQLDGGSNVVNPPGEYQCIAVSKSGDPVSGGWNFYSLHLTDGLGDYPKFGVWPDGIYMSANIFGFPSGGSFMTSRVWALNKAQMYAGAPSIQVVQFNAPAADFTLLPANARLQAGTPPVGSPNYFSVVWQYINAVSVYKFHVDWNSISLSSFSGPFYAIAPTSWANPPTTVQAQGGNANDTLAKRLMMQSQYANIGGTESLWNAHTVLGGATGTAAPRYYQTDVTGGTIAPNTTQAFTHTPDTTVNRYMPSLAIDRAGDMAMGYSASSSTLMPAVRYAGRLASDPLNSLPQTETSLVEGTGAQNTSTRWGDYSAMSLDPDGCTFWYTNEYYIATGGDWQTRVGSFAFPSCTPVATGTLQGTVSVNPGGAPISGATVALGSRTATTNASGVYQFAGLASGTYPGMTASEAGFSSASASGIVVSDGVTTTKDFSLTAAPSSQCLTDTTQADFQTGVASNVDLTTSPDDVLLLNAANADQQNATLSTSGVGITITTWGGQTFTAGVTGQLTKVDVNLFCSGCTGTTPNLTLSLRATSGGLPTGADLAAATLAGNGNGASSYFTGTFSPAPTLTAGTMYALVVRPTANPSPGTYALTRSTTNVYANGTRVSGATSGTVWSIPLTSGQTTDAGFVTYINTGFALSGNLLSSTKDSNLAVGQTPTWSTLSWTASTPASTALQFQVAGSNSANGPFNFVGPDGTASTFYTTSGGSLSQFDGLRYLQYQADLSTSNNAATPVLNDVTVCYATQAPPDLSITKTDGVTTAVPGGSVTYTIVASNATATPASSSATVADTFPASLTCTWSCASAGGATCTASGAGNINDAVNFPANSSATYTASCAIAASASGTLVNTATVSLTGDPDSANDSATDSDTLTPQSDLAITKTDGVTTATAGGSVTYTISASNAGPSNVTGATVADTFPASLTCTWTCSASGGGTCTAAGSGNINEAVNLPSGGSTTHTASCSVAPSATGTLSNTATVTAPAGVTDPTPGNNSATDSDTILASADLAITKTDGVTSATAGGSVTYTITASNAGPSNASGATVADTFPASETCTWTCAGSGGGTCTAAGSGNINAVVNLPSGGSTTHTASCTLSPAATGTLSNTATVTAPAGVTDPTPGNNSATDSDTLLASADLSITKTDGVTSATAGGSVTYTITASNAGPSSATGATVADTFPASLTCTWTCSGTGGGTCIAAGSGNINASVNLPSGGSTTHLASCSISPTATGTLSNTATITAPAGVTDPTPGNNSATDSDTLAAHADIALTLTDNRDFVQVGDALDYVIEVTNPSGPSTAVAHVSDPLSALLTSGSWVCTGSGGANCANGSGNSLSDTATIPVGGKAAYLYSATLQSSGASDQVANTASATLTNGTDSVPANNSATDTDIVVIFRDGFEGSTTALAALDGADGYATAHLLIDAQLLDQLGMMPVAVANGRASGGATLFTLELARFGDDYALRILTRDEHGLSERTSWQTLDTSARLLSFAWQASSAQPGNGYLSANGGGAELLVSGRREEDRLTHLSIRVENSVPWLVLIAQ